MKIRVDGNYVYFGEHKLDLKRILDIVLIATILVLGYNIGHYDAIQYHKILWEYSKINCPCMFIDKNVAVMCIENRFKTYLDAY